jgi:DNA-binding GntR family transcriptional regulator
MIEKVGGQTVSPLGVGPIASRQSVPELVLTELRGAILEGRLPPGSRLKLDELASGMGVSHMPVRQALEHLIVEGLATRVAHRGVVVNALTTADVVSAYHTVGVLEQQVAREVVGRLTPETLRELHRLLEEEQALTKAGDYEALLRTNRAFHALIFAACGNRWVLQFLTQLGDYTYRLRRTYPQSPSRIVAAASEHVAMLDALARGDADELSRLVDLHNQRALADLMPQLEDAIVRQEAR